MLFMRGYFDQVPTLSVPGLSDLVFFATISASGTFYNIHTQQSFVKNKNLSKNLQNKFAFPAFGGIVTIKGLETLADSGCNADIVGVSPVQLFYKSILGLETQTERK